MSDLRLKPRLRPRPKLRVRLIRYLRRVGLETIIKGRKEKEKETKDKIVEAIPTLKEMGCLSQ